MEMVNMMRNSRKPVAYSGSSPVGEATTPSCFSWMLSAVECSPLLVEPVGSLASISALLLLSMSGLWDDMFLGCSALLCLVGLLRGRGSVDSGE